MKKSGEAHPISRLAAIGGLVVISMLTGCPNPSTSSPPTDMLWTEIAGPYAWNSIASSADGFLRIRLAVLRGQLLEVVTAKRRRTAWC